MFGTYHRNRLLLLIGAIWSAIVFHFAGRWFSIPQFEGYNVSLLMQSSPIATLLIVGIAIIVSVITCTLIAGSVRADAGLFCTALGLMAISLRGGTIRYTLFDATGNSVFARLAVELCLLFALIGVAWLIVCAIASAGLTRRDDPDFKRDEISFDQKLLGTAIQACATATLVLILCRTDQKVQALASVGIASLLGSILAVTVAPTRPSFWFWIGPLLVGLLGYITAAMSSKGLAIGQVTGYFAALARPLPIDYASAGVAGAMLGYWFGQSWMRAGESGEESQPTSAGTIA